MILRLLLILLLCSTTGCTPGFFHLTHRKAPDHSAAAPQVMTAKEKKVRLKFLKADIKAQQKRIERYKTQDPANKLGDPLYFVSDVEYAEAQTKLAKEQAELETLGN